MSKDPIRELQLIDEITEEIATQLVAEGIDTFDKILVAGGQGLTRIQGITEDTLKPILRQAAALTDEMQRSKQTRSAIVEEKVIEFKKDFRDFIKQTRERYADKMDKDKVQAFLRESKRLETALEAIERNLTGYLREVHKSLEEAEEEILSLSDSKIRETTRTLKKTRKQLTKVIE